MALPALRDITLIATIYLFFAGFVYRDLYLSGLGVSPNTIDVSLNTILVYAFTVFQVNWWLAPLLFLTLIALSMAAWKALWMPALLAATALAGTGAFGILYVAAASAADRVDIDTRLGRVAGINAVTLSLRDGGRSYDRKLFRDVVNEKSTKMTAYLVDENAATYFILIQPRPLKGSRNLNTGYLYVVPRADVLHMRRDVAGRQNAF